jgi:hypothetical protein
VTNRRAREAALRIQLLLEEFTLQELEEGLSLLGALRGEDLLRFLLRRVSSQQSRKKSVAAARKTDDLFSLRRIDPEKYDVIQSFGARLRDGSVLPTLDSCRAFGKDLSKDFDAGKSRKEAIGHLLALMAKMNTAEIRSAITKANSLYESREGTEPFQRLAGHIISGSTR